MPIIQPKNKIEKTQFRISISQAIYQQVQQYCEQFQVGKVDRFFEEAAEYLLSRDKDWLALKINKPTV